VAGQRVVCKQGRHQAEAPAEGVEEVVRAGVARYEVVGMTSPARCGIRVNPLEESAKLCGATCGWDRLRVR